MAIDDAQAAVACLEKGVPDVQAGYPVVNAAGEKVGEVRGGEVCIDRPEGLDPRFVSPPPTSRTRKLADLGDAAADHLTPEARAGLAQQLTNVAGDASDWIDNLKVVPLGTALAALTSLDEWWSRKPREETKGLTTVLFGSCELRGPAEDVLLWTRLLPDVDEDTPTIREKLLKFMYAAGGEGLVLDGVDAGDLYAKLFPIEVKERP